MATLALAARITHLPSMQGQLLDPRQGSRQAAIAGHLEVSRRCRALGVDSLVVFDRHWLVNANDHVNCAPHFKGHYTSHELPHCLSNLPCEIPGKPELGQLRTYGFTLMDSAYDRARLGIMRLQCLCVTSTQETTS